MARKDDLLTAFLSDSIIREKYGIEENSIISFNEALDSDIPIVKMLAVIVQNYTTHRNSTPSSEQNLYNEVINYLNNQP